MVDADSAKSILEDELNKPSLASWIGGSVHVRVMRKIRDWVKHHADFSPVKLAACFTCWTYLFGGGG